jgi:peroxiredoxin
MAQLRQDYGKFQAAGAEVVVIGPDDVEAFSNYWTENELPFIGLPDPEHLVADLYGQETRLLKLGRMPAQVVVDMAGVARFVHYGRSMKDIPDNEEILNLLAALPAPVGLGDV